MGLTPLSPHLQLCTLALPFKSKKFPQGRNSLWFHWIPSLVLGDEVSEAEKGASGGGGEAGSGVSLSSLLTWISSCGIRSLARPRPPHPHPWNPARAFLPCPHFFGGVCSGHTSSVSSVTPMMGI